MFEEERAGVLSQIAERKGPARRIGQLDTGAVLVGTAERWVRGRHHHVDGDRLRIHL